MAQKCVHKGCGKTFTDPDEPCVYHPGPPEFHEGQKGWKCCKPRVLTFDEFLEIPPCTTGKHSTVDDAPLPEPKNAIDESLLKSATPSNASANPPRRVPIAQNVAAVAAAGAVKPASPAPPESDSDDPAQPTPAGASCKRRGCNAVYSASASRDSEECVYHPGQALFHEGSKGWTCCKRRVLEFDEFMKIAGCKKRSRHCFVGKREAERKKAGLLEKLETVRHDFYQTSSTIHASLFLKKIDKDKSRVEFPPSQNKIVLDLKTSDGKAYESVMQLYGKIDPAKSAFKILGTKLELTLAKADGLGWPVLRADEKHKGEIIQTGRAGMA